MQDFRDSSCSAAQKQRRDSGLQEIQSTSFDLAIQIVVPNLFGAVPAIPADLIFPSDLPMTDSNRAELKTFVHVLGAVRRLETPAQLFTLAELLECQGFIHALVQASSRRAIDRLQFCTKGRERFFGKLVARLLPRGLKPSLPLGSSFFTEVSQYVFPFVTLTAGIDSGQ